MNQQTIDKLMEIKKLYQAGILTKEEMMAEKAKILPSTTSPNVKDENNLDKDLPNVKIDVSDDIKNETKSVINSHTPETTPQASKTIPKQGQPEDTNVLPFAIAFALAIILIIASAILSVRCSTHQKYDNDYYAVDDTDTVPVDDVEEDIVVGDNQEQNTQTYAEKAEDYIRGLDTDARVVASLTDNERHCVYTLTEVETDDGRFKNLYCHDLETGSTNLVKVPYKIDGEEYGERVGDAKLVGDNLYVVNTSYRCGDCVVCLNTFTGDWSCIVKTCASAKFIGGSRMKVTYSKLVYEGECLAENQYELTDKVITLR